MPQVKAGKLRALGVSSAKRTAAAPDVADDRGAGLRRLRPGRLVHAVRAGRRRRRRCSRGCATPLAQAVTDPEVKARLAAQGLEVPLLKPEELAAFGRTEMAKWSELVKRSGAHVD